MSQVNINKEYKLPKIFNSIDVNINKVNIAFDIVSFLEECHEFEDIVNAMLKAPSVYSYFLIAKVDQEKLVRDLKDALDSWFDDKYKTFIELSPKSNVTTIKALVKSFQDKSGVLVYSKYWRRYKVRGRSLR